MIPLVVASIDWPRIDLPKTPTFIEEAAQFLLCCLSVHTATYFWMYNAQCITI